MEKVVYLKVYYMLLYSILTLPPSHPPPKKNIVQNYTCICIHLIVDAISPTYDERRVVVPFSFALVALPLFCLLDSEKKRK